MSVKQGASCRMLRHNGERAIQFVVAILMMTMVHSPLHLTGQELPVLQARFNNPVFEPNSLTYTVDIELQSRASAESLFGTNLRFFFDATKLDFLRLHSFHTGYGFIGEAPVAYVGSPESGSLLFGFDGAAGYLNCAIQLLNPQTPLVLGADSWAKVCRLDFRVSEQIPAGELFCPSLLFDIKQNGQTGSFLQGAEGLLFTVLESDPNTPFESAPAMAMGIPFNWQYDVPEAIPHGSMMAEQCILLEETVSTEENGVADFLVYQNQPNPFSDRTVIRFSIPAPQDVTLLLYDAEGRRLEERTAFYPAGENQLVLFQESWMEKSGVVFYRLRTKDHSSPLFGMTVIRK